MTKREYYKQFEYHIEKKITVEDISNIKDYSKQGIFIYVIKEETNKNRFIFISSKHYSDKTIIEPETFKIYSVNLTKEYTYLKKCKSKFNQIFFRVLQEKTQETKPINLAGIVWGKRKEGTPFKRFKVHEKAIACDNPDWYIEQLKKIPVTSHKKKTIKELLCKNKYNEEIIEHSISSLMSLNSSKYQRFNDHTIILDEGNTGKSSLVSYMCDKADNVSIAGLYGSSDGKNGCFRQGLLGRTKKNITIDELNELAEDKRGDKILSILNSILENGEYNYVKQFSSKIYSSHQFFFLGNLKDDFNMSLFLESCIGNNATFGRRIGIITYNNNLKGFEKGNLRNPNPNSYLRAVSLFMTNILNYIMQNTKFLEKLRVHKDYRNKCFNYVKELRKINSDSENPLISGFIKSHGDAVDRIIFRALKLWIFYNLDDLLSGLIEYNNLVPFQVLSMSDKIFKSNLRNIKNMVEHVNNSTITSRTEEQNKDFFNKFSISTQELINFFCENKDIINQKKPISKDFFLNIPRVLQKRFYHWQTRGVSKNITKNLMLFGCKIIKQKDTLSFMFTNKSLFENKTAGIFSEIAENKPLKEEIKEEKEDLEIDLSDLN